MTGTTTCTCGHADWEHREVPTESGFRIGPCDVCICEGFVDRSAVARREKFDNHPNYAGPPLPPPIPPHDPEEPFRILDESLDRIRKEASEDLVAALRTATDEARNLAIAFKVLGATVADVLEKVEAMNDDLDDGREGDDGDDDIDDDLDDGPPGEVEFGG